MRDIKFRAWLIEKKEMVIPDTIHYNKGYGGALQIYVPNPKFEPYKHIVKQELPKETPFWDYINHSLDVHLKETPNQFILEQYTGLKDKNGKEIYEGDIVRYSFSWTNTQQNREFIKGKVSERGISIGVVEFESNGMAHYVFNPSRINCRNDMILIEVIGNIHENKKLLTNNLKK